MKNFIATIVFITVLTGIFSLAIVQDAKQLENQQKCYGLTGYECVICKANYR